MSFYFNNTDLSPYLTVNVNRSLLPELATDTTDVPGVPGARLASRKLKPLKIPAKIRLKASPSDTVSEIRRILAGIFYTKVPVPLILPDEPTVYYMAMLDGSSDFDNLWYTGSAEITFLCLDPIAYGAADKVTVSASDFRVGGTYPTYPVIIAKPAAGSYFRITNNLTGEYVQLTRTFTGNETVKIDCEKQVTTVNGMPAQVVLASDYFQLDPGVNNLVRSSGLVTAEWQERWI